MPKCRACKSYTTTQYVEFCEIVRGKGRIISGNDESCEKFEARNDTTLIVNVKPTQDKPLKSGTSKNARKHLEQSLQKTCLDYLRLKGVFGYKNNTTGIRKSDGGWIPSQAVGCPDLTCIINKQYVGIEVKSEKGVLSDKQKEFGQLIRAGGGLYWVVRSLDDLITEMKKLGVE